jgi:hypothetical protein
VEGKPLNKKCILTDFAYGLIIGFITAVIIFMTIFGLVYVGNKNREMSNYVELQQAIEELREDYINRDASEFLDTIPGVRTAADGARDDFERKLDEILLRFRSRLAD